MTTFQVSLAHPVAPLALPIPVQEEKLWRQPVQRPGSQQRYFLQAPKHVSVHGVLIHIAQLEVLRRSTL